MKNTFLICLTLFSFSAIAQVKNKPVVQTIKNGQSNIPNFGFRKVDPTIQPATINGNYTIEKHELQVKTSETKSALKAVGSTLIISDTLIVGNKINTIDYKITESLFMNTEDYLYRVFGKFPEVLPTDLPTELTVHKTNNLDCYGIAELPNGVLLIPYKGLLFYLREF